MIAKRLLPKRLLFLPLLAACSVSSEEAERVASSAAAFSSADAVLVELELDAKLVSPTNDPPEARKLLETQLMFLVGQLNADRSVGRHDRLDLTVTSIRDLSAESPAYEIAYHVRLPIAWGNGATPSSYPITLPLRVEQSEQARFAAKYSGPCTDPEGGDVDTGRMFLFFRPRRAGCAFAPEDVMTTTGTIHPATGNTSGKYPEYHRIWEDSALDIVAVFGREHGDDRTNDDGALAYQSFLERLSEHLREMQPDDAQRIDERDATHARLGATLPGARTVRVDAILIGPDVSHEPAFDAWYDARTPAADMIVYSGHAGLGDNVKAFFGKGTFVAKKYVVYVINGCDTFAYLDRTLPDRRFSLNPDDPSGTKYMDTVSNVLGGYFRTSDETSLHLALAMVSSTRGAPKTYPEIFHDVDDTQVMVVSGEEDNEFEPSMMHPSADTTPPPPSGATVSPEEQPRPNPRRAPRREGCHASPPARGPTSFAVVLTLIASALAVKRRRSP